MVSIVPKRPLGIFSKAHLESEELFTELQGLALLYIKEQFSLENASFKLEGATWDQFFRERERAEQEGRLDEFEQSLMEQLMPAMQQLMQQEQPRG